MTFVIIGADPTGVEMVGFISELSHVIMRRDSRNILTRDTRIILVEAGPRVLASFPSAQSQKAQTKVWAAGVQVPDLDKWLDVETDRAGRVVVKPDLSVLGHDDAFVIGDAASVPWKDGLNLPCIAPAVKQQGKNVARLRQARMASAEAPKPFFYSHAGNSRRSRVIQQ